MPYLLTLLGTDTVYKPTPALNCPRAELLSVTATLETAAVNTDEGLSHPHVINGPDTLGTEVGNRIGLALTTLLAKLATGETTISITAHSRGAVQAILVAHELQRIRDALIDDIETPILEILQATPCPYTKAYFDNIELENDNVETSRHILSALQQLNLSLFCIDPVPGGAFGPITATRWVDERFFSVPSIVKHFQLYTYANERSRCFRTIIPACQSADETLFEWHVIPGHHGTGSGNFLDQMKKGEVSPIWHETADVQTLLFYKLILFLESKGHVFDLSNIEALPTTSSQPEHPTLKILRPFLEQTSLAERQRMIIGCYQSIQAHIKHYQHFNNTAYPVLGQEGNPIRTLLTGAKKDRYVHYHQHTSHGTNLSRLAPPPAEGFVNTDHARLWLANVTGLLDVKQSLQNESVESSIAALRLCNEKLSFINPNIKILYINTLLNLIVDEDTGAPLLNAFSAILNDCSITLLRNHLTDQQKHGLINAIEQTYSQLSRIISAYDNIGDDDAQQKQAAFLRFHQWLDNQMQQMLVDNIDSLAEKIEPFFYQQATESPDMLLHDFEARFQDIESYLAGLALLQDKDIESGCFKSLPKLIAKLTAHRHALLGQCAHYCADNNITISEVLAGSSFCDQIENLSYAYGAPNPILAKFQSANRELAGVISAAQEQLCAQLEKITELEQKVAEQGDEISQLNQQNSTLAKGKARLEAKFLQLQQTHAADKAEFAAQVAEKNANILQLQQVHAADKAELGAQVTEKSAQVSQLQQDYMEQVNRLKQEISTLKGGHLQSATKHNLKIAELGVEKNIALKQLDEQKQLNEALKAENIKLEQALSQLSQPVMNAQEQQAQSTLITLNQNVMDYLKYLSQQLGLSIEGNVYADLASLNIDQTIIESTLGQKYQFVQSIQQAIFARNSTALEKLNDIQAKFTPENIGLMASHRSGFCQKIWCFLKSLFNLANPFSQSYYNSTHSHAFWQPRGQSFCQVSQDLIERPEVNSANQVI